MKKFMIEFVAEQDHRIVQGALMIYAIDESELLFIFELLLPYGPTVTILKITEIGYV